MTYQGETQIIKYHVHKAALLFLPQLLRSQSLVLIAAARGSIAKQNNRGERDKLCLEPLPSVNYSEMSPLVCTITSGCLLSPLYFLLPNPQIFRILNKQPHSTISNTFSASKERAATGDWISITDHIILIKPHII